MSGRATIALIGMRGAGKTTVGRALAELLAVPFVDLDESTLAWARRVGVRAGDVGELLVRVGGWTFRRMEAQALRALLEPCQRLVVATGGGTVEDADARAWLRRAARVVWLRADPARLAERIGSDPTSRPALDGRDTLAEIPTVLARREPIYASLAEVVVDSAAGPPEEIAARIREAL